MGVTARQTILRTLVIPCRLATGSSHLGHDAWDVVPCLSSGTTWQAAGRAGAQQ